MKMLILIQEDPRTGGRGKAEHDCFFHDSDLTESCVPTTGSYRSRYTCLKERDMTHHETTVFRKL